MERKSSGMACLVVMMMLCVGVGAGEFQTSSLADVVKCTAIVYNVCRKLKKSPIECGAMVYAQCKNHTNLAAMSGGSSSAASNGGVTPKQRYCELGCAVSRCTNITATEDNPNVDDQLGECFETCSENTCKPKINGGNDEQTSDDFCKLGCAKSLCGETADKDTVCESCATPCSNSSTGPGI